jgi:GTP-binding protein
VAVRPPTIVLSVNNPDLFREDYRRFIENRFREELPFPEVPIRLILRAHREDRPGGKRPKVRRRKHRAPQNETGRRKRPRKRKR